MSLLVQVHGDCILVDLAREHFVPTAAFLCGGTQAGKQIDCGDDFFHRLNRDESNYQRFSVQRQSNMCSVLHRMKR